MNKNNSKSSKKAKQLKQSTLNFGKSAEKVHESNLNPDNNQEKTDELNVVSTSKNNHTSSNNEIATTSNADTLDQTESNENEVEESGGIESDYNENYEKYIKSRQVQQKDCKRHFISCTVCVKYPEIVRRSCKNTRPPPITTELGVRYRKQYVLEHFASPYHKQCVEADLIARNELQNINQNKNFMDVHISESNKSFANYIGKLLITVYNDAKKLTLSAFSFPSRYIASECGACFDFNSPNAPIIPSKLNVQYVNPVGHLNLLNAIVASSVDFEEKLKSAIAASIHVDGSVDRTQIDKIYIILKLSTSKGDLETVFLGIGQQTDPGSSGLMNAIRRGIIDNVGEDVYALILSIITSICTDGAGINRGEKKSLWKFIEDEVKKYQPDVPFIKLWCAAHRVDLVWGDVTRSNGEVKEILNMLSSLASYFHKSSLRLEALKKIASEKELTLLSLPKLFEVRWTEWTFIMIQNMLRSWNVLVLYFESREDDAQAIGYLNFLKNHENLKLLVFLCDVLHVYQRYHKKVQSDHLTIVTLNEHISTLKTTLKSLLNSNLIGGWEEVLKKSIVIEDNKVYLNQIELITAVRRRTIVSNTIDDKRIEIIDTLVNCLEKRFEEDTQMMSIIEPFLNFDAIADIRKIHETFATDLNLATLGIEYTELISIFERETKKETLTQKIKFLLSHENTDNFQCAIKILCRIQSLTPQSADCERLIKANNILKTAFRNSISVETENKYLFVHINMPALEEWNPRNAIVFWIKDKQRREHEEIINKQTFRRQRWFKGIFSEANLNNDDEYEINESTNEEKKIKGTEKIKF